MRTAQTTWPLLVFLVAVVVYGCTLARTFTWCHDGADGGDLIAAAATLGVPHPSGYPTYVLLARLFLGLLPRGEPAFRVHWLSALSAAGAATLLALSMAEGDEDGKRGGGGDEGQSPRPPIPLSPCLDLRRLTRIAATTASLIFAFSPLTWGQATIAEVHALNVAFVAAVFYLLLRWRARGRLWPAVVMAFLYGLSLGNHLTGLLLLPAALCWLLAYGLSRPQQPGADGQTCGEPSPAIRGSSAGSDDAAEVDRDLSSPGGHWGWRSWLAMASAFPLGLTVYVYLPLAAARQPPINWGDPRTWDRFWWVVSGRLYRDAIFGVPLAFIPGRLSAWGHLLLEQFGWWGWIPALVGLWRLSRRDRGALGFSFYVFAAYSLYAVTYDRADSYVYLLPACLMVAFWLGQGLVALLQAFRQRTQRALPVALFLVVLLPLVPLVSHFAAQDLRRERAAADFAMAALAATGPGGLIIASGDRDTFALWYHRYALGARPDVTVLNANLWGFDWYRRTLAAHRPEVARPRGDTLPPILPELIRANVSLRPVYATEEALAAVGDYELEPAGPLYRLRP